MDKHKITYRKACVDDLNEIQSLFVTTIDKICRKDYTPEQIDVWISSVKNTNLWLEKLQKQFFLLAILESKIIGFISLDGADYLDLLYVHKDFQDKGIATLLFSNIENEALRNGAKFLGSDVSITARYFFEKCGFTVICRQTKLIHGVEIVNYKMRKELKTLDT